MRENVKQFCCNLQTSFIILFCLLWCIVKCFWVFKSYGNPFFCSANKWTGFVCWIASHNCSKFRFRVKIIIQSFWKSDYWMLVVRIFNTVNWVLVFWNSFNLKTWILQSFCNDWKKCRTFCSTWITEYIFDIEMIS